MRFNIAIVVTMLALTACTQEPASVVVHKMSEPAKSTSQVKNPYKVVITPGDTLYKISKLNNVEIREIIDLNAMRPPYTLLPGQTVKLPKARFHVVGPSDNLYAISRSYDVDISRLAQKNNIEAPYNLTTGQKLLLPAKTEIITSDNGSNTTSYDFSTKVATSDTGVKQEELAPLSIKSSSTTSPKTIKSANTANTEDDDNPFAEQLKSSSEKSSQNNKINTKQVTKTGASKNINEKNYQTSNKPLDINSGSRTEATTDKSADFAYKSEREFGYDDKITSANNDSAKTNAKSKINANQKLPLAENSKANTKTDFKTDSEKDSSNIAIAANNKDSGPAVKVNNILAESEDSNIDTDNNDNPFKSASKNNNETEVKSSKAPNSNVLQSFTWPVKGQVISKFGPKKGGLYNDGINIAAKEGAKITAAYDGEVVYKGNELRGYGNMLLIKHDSGYLTAYAHVDEFLVKKGDVVKKGQAIAHVGQSGHVNSPQLHFSIREGRKAIDPEKYLPRS